MRPSRIADYEFDENSFGEILLGLYDMDAEVGAATFIIEDDDLLLHYDNGEIVRIVGMVKHLGPQKVATMTEFAVAETDETDIIRSYLVKKAPAV